MRSDFSLNTRPNLGCKDKINRIQIKHIRYSQPNIGNISYKGIHIDTYIASFQVKLFQALQEHHKMIAHPNSSKRDTFQRKQKLQ